MIIKDERYVIATTSTPIKFEADTRKQFYRKGDLTEDILDSYLWINEDDANEFIHSNIDSFGDSEVRKVSFTCEVD